MLKGKTALVSCYNKNGLVTLCSWLFNNGYKIITTGGTYNHISQSQIGNETNLRHLQHVEQVTGFPEILGGRVKTLHPKIHGGLLADITSQEHQSQLEQHAIDPIDLVVANLYPFWNVTKNVSEQEAIELIDIGGVAMIRAAAKNYKHVTVLTDPTQYEQFLKCNGQPSETIRKNFAHRAFVSTSDYDSRIAQYFDNSAATTTTKNYILEYPLKYGCNPHQTPAGIYSINGRPIPLKVLNGECGYINILDAVGCWGLVHELQQLTGRVAACSFKHTSPAGAAVAMDFDQLSTRSQTILTRLYGLTSSSSAAVNAYIRARNSDPQSSFGDFIGISTIVDVDLANVIKKFVSDGIVAPGYTDEALAILKEKKKGNYVIIQMTQPIIPFEGAEYREIAGFAIAQPVNTQQITENDLTPDKIVTKHNGDIGTDAKRDLIIANACLKFAQSNNVACATEGQLIGLSAGQQSRVHSVQLACNKAKIWITRHTSDQCFPDKNLPFQDLINETTRSAEILSPGESASQYTISLASDAFFPFPDSIAVAAASINVRYVTQTGGSMRDDLVIDECNQKNIVMFFTGKRIFTH